MDAALFSQVRAQRFESFHWWNSSTAALGLFGPPNFGIQHIEEMVQFRKDWEKKGALAATGGDSAMGPVAGMGGGGVVAWDNFSYFDPSDKYSADGTFEYLEAQAKYLAEHKLGGQFGRANALKGEQTVKKFLKKYAIKPWQILQCESISLSSQIKEAT